MSSSSTSTHALGHSTYLGRGRVDIFLFPKDWLFYKLRNYDLGHLDLLSAGGKGTPTVYCSSNIDHGCLIRAGKRPSLRVSQAMRMNASPSMMRWLSNDTRVKIQNAVKEDPLVVFMKGSPSMPQCGFSRAVLQILQVQGVNTDKVATYNCLEDQELRDGIKEFSDWPTIPQVYINGEFVGGCDILLNLHQTGELETMLRDAGLLLEATENQQ